MKVIYVSGPYRAGTEAGVQENIHRAWVETARLWSAGFAVICPHKNTEHMEGLEGVSNDDILAGELELVSRCDAIYMLKGWVKSDGAKAEHTEAGRLGLKVYYESGYCCNRCNSPVEEGTEKFDGEYPYYCLECDENMYSFEVHPSI